MNTILLKIILKIKWIFRKKRLVPTMAEKRKVIAYYRKTYSPTVLVETGTFLGDTVEYFKNEFDRIISIELSEVLAAKATQRFKNDKNVRIIQGDSSDILPGVISELTGPVLFWLDGHYSSSFFVNDEFIQTAKGKVNTPIELELYVILQSPIESVILIDDARLFNGKDDYPDINAIRRILDSHGYDYDLSVEKDIIVIIPKVK